MSARVLLLVSLAVNVGLGVVVYRRVTAPAAAALIRREVRLAAVPVPTNAGGTTEVMVTGVAGEFEWSRLAAGDFKKYRDNLRAVGCPEATVRDIITAEIEEQYLAKRRAVLDGFQKVFWESVARDRRWVERGDWEEAVGALGEERDRLLTEVLGQEAEEEGGLAEQRTKRREQRYAWLPEEQRNKLVALEMEGERKQRAWREEVKAQPGHKWTEADQARRKALEQELAAARKQLLTPGELAEYELRKSSGGSWAVHLPGFEPSEEEWRAVASLRNQYDKATLEAVDVPTGLPMDRWNGVRERLEAELKETTKATLGAERYKEYELAGSNEYQQTRRITKRYGLPDALAAEAFGIQQNAQAAAGTVRGDDSLSPEARMAALRAIEAETRRALEQKLEGKVWGTYQKYNGDWLKKFTEVEQGGGGSE